MLLDCSPAMMTRILSAGLIGIDAFPVDVEVDIKNTALPGWSTVGLADSEVRESKERVIAAIRNSGLDSSVRKVTINLAPADIPKEGTAYDLAIAVGILVSSAVLQPAVPLHECLIVGELALGGGLRPVRGTLPVTVLARDQGVKRVIVPRANVAEASVVQGVEVWGFKTLLEVVEFIGGLHEGALAGPHSALPPDCQAGAVRTDTTDSNLPPPASQDTPDFSDIRGQYTARRALEVAAAGGHNVLLSGPPGCGKTLLASRMPTILPPLSFDEALETTRIYSIAGDLPAGRGLVRARPFRSPHHSISHAGLIGGGSLPRPGEVTLAHNGVLFLDELPEFQRSALETLRQPLETGVVTIARARQTLSFPARFILVASCNPCPCGFAGHPEIKCHCSPLQTKSYRARLSGPLLDRIDIRLDVPALHYDELRAPPSSAVSCETSATISSRVAETRARQSTRFGSDGGKTNSRMSPRQVEKHCRLDAVTEDILRTAATKYSLSARAIHRVLKVARTVADLSGESSIAMPHLLEALQYRGIYS